MNDNHVAVCTECGELGARQHDGSLPAAWAMVSLSGPAPVSVQQGPYCSPMCLVRDITRAIGIDAVRVASAA